MTNEQLAALAQQPENEELVPLLWEKVKPLLWLKAKQTYNARQSVFQQCGVELMGHSARLLYGVSECSQRVQAGNRH